MPRRFITLLVRESTYTDAPKRRLNIDARVVFLSNTLLDLMADMNTSLDAISTPIKKDMTRVPLIDVTGVFLVSAQHMFTKHVDFLLTNFSALLPPSDSIINSSSSTMAFATNRDSPQHASLVMMLHSFISRDLRDNRNQQMRKLELFSYFGIAAGFLNMPFLTDVFAHYFSDQLVTFTGYYLLPSESPGMAPTEVLNPHDESREDAKWFEIDMTLIRNLRPILLRSTFDNVQCIYCGIEQAIGTCSICQGADFCSSTCFGVSAHSAQCVIPETPFGALFEFHAVPPNVEKVNFFWGYSDATQTFGVGFDTTERAIIVSYRSFREWTKSDLLHDHTSTRFIRLVSEVSHDIRADDLLHVMTARASLVNLVLTSTSAVGLAKAAYERQRIVDIFDITSRLAKNLAPILRGTQYWKRNPTGIGSYVFAKDALIGIIKRRIKHDNDSSQKAEKVMCETIARFLDVLDPEMSSSGPLSFTYGRLIAAAKNKNKVLLTKFFEDRAKRLNINIPDHV
jgi:hypothetical protein